MQNLWQKKLKLNYSLDVFDIVQFGSSIFENSDKPSNDLDIAVIFVKIPIKEQLVQAQKIKSQIEKYSSLPVHINSFDLYSFFDKSNFARENILFYGLSLNSGDYFSKKFGLNPKIYIYYSLQKLKKKEKVRFNYTLNGKKGEYGLLRKYGGKILKPGLVEIDPVNEKIFVESIKKITSDYIVKKIFLQ